MIDYKLDLEWAKIKIKNLNYTQYLYIIRIGTYIFYKNEKIILLLG